jgi:peptidyl-prolyl cis-trans isomerase B (cyclophilin B)
MRSRKLLILAVAAIAAAACHKKEQAAGPPGETDSLPTVVLETSKGRIVLELNRTKAPLTVANILAHVDQHFYDGLTFHRVIKGFMIQCGMATADGHQRLSSAPPVPNEADNGLKNVRGALGLARTADPQSGGVQFFINVVDNPWLDFQSKSLEGWGYAVFGRVKEGMDIADQIAAVPGVDILFLGPGLWHGVRALKERMYHCPVCEAETDQIGRAHV